MPEGACGDNAGAITVTAMSPRSDFSRWIHGVCILHRAFAMDRYGFDRCRPVEASARRYERRAALSPPQDQRTGHRATRSNVTTSDRVNPSAPERFNSPPIRTSGRFATNASSSSPASAKSAQSREAPQAAPSHVPRHICRLVSLERDTTSHRFQDDGPCQNRDDREGISALGRGTARRAYRGRPAFSNLCGKLWLLGSGKRATW